MLIAYLHSSMVRLESRNKNSLSEVYKKKFTFQYG